MDAFRAKQEFSQRQCVCGFRVCVDFQLKANLAWTSWRGVCSSISYLLNAELQRGVWHLLLLSPWICHPRSSVQWPPLWAALPSGLSVWGMHTWSCDCIRPRPHVWYAHVCWCWWNAVSNEMCFFKLQKTSLHCFGKKKKLSSVYLHLITVTPVLQQEILQWDLPDKKNKEKFWNWERTLWSWGDHGVIPAALRLQLINLLELSILED